MAETVEKGDIVSLIGDKVHVVIAGKRVKLDDALVLDTCKLLGKKYGERVRLGSKTFVVARATLHDMFTALERKAQVINPKDAAFIGYHCDIRPNKRVVEGGLGTGAMCMYLAAMVRPEGVVYSYEIRSDMIRVAKQNLEKFGLLQNVVIRRADITKGVAEKNIDAAVLDIPEPWRAARPVYDSLRAGGAVSAYVPTMNQAEECAEAFQSVGFARVKCYELLLREILARKGKTRPSFDMLGHTGYIVIGRKLATGL